MKRSIRLFPIILSFLNIGLVSAQEFKCGTEIPPQKWENQFQELINHLNQNASKGNAQLPVYTIPVIIHLVHGGEPVGTYPNLAQGQLNSQIQVLNDDFGGIGFNSSNYPATAFSAWAINQALPSANIDGNGRVKIANCDVQFCLATIDTLGNILPEPGIDRINYITEGWANPNSFGTITALKAFINGTVKPQTIWNVSKYLNIWVTDENIGAIGLLGYATFPPLSTLPGNGTPLGTNTTDGFWCYAKTFGSINTYSTGTYYSSSYNKGRVSTHELGHYFGLRHIWGDGTCASDYCNDTPSAPANNGGNPSYPLSPGSCSSPTNAPDGEMFMNFMDYTSDNAKYMYTTDQRTRVQTTMANSPYRKFLGTHGLCMSTIAASANFSVNSNVCVSTSISLSNSSVGAPTPSYTWSSTGSATFSPSTNAANPTIYFSSPGIYTVNLVALNGPTSNISKTITVIATPTLVIASNSQTICSGSSATVLASGATSYTWNTNATTNAIAVTPTATTIYTVSTSCNVTETATVMVNPIPNVSATSANSIICLGQTIVLTAAGANSYTWQPMNISGTTVIASPSSTQVYTITGISTNGCTGSSTIVVTVSPCSGIIKLNGDNFMYNVYPNPSKDEITLYIKTDRSIEMETELLDLKGKIISRQTIIFDSSKFIQQINITSVSNGVYFLKLSSRGGDVQTIKLVKE